MGVSFTSVPGLGHQNTCQDRNECLDGSNDCTGVNTDAHECNNAVGTFSCACNSGYQFTSAISVHPQNSGNGFDCEDVDECSTSVDECSDNTDCNNDVGTY